MENKIMLRNFRMKVDAYSKSDLAKFYWLCFAVLLVFYVLGWQGQSRERSAEFSTVCNQNLHTYDHSEVSETQNNSVNLISCFVFKLNAFVLLIPISYDPQVFDSSFLCYSCLKLSDSSTPIKIGFKLLALLNQPKNQTARIPLSFDEDLLIHYSELISSCEGESCEIIQYLTTEYAI